MVEARTGLEQRGRKQLAPTTVKVHMSLRAAVHSWIFLLCRARPSIPEWKDHSGQQYSLSVSGGGALILRRDDHLRDGYG